MDGKKIEALLTAVDKGSLTQAAELLGYTPSGMVHLVNGLEKEIGFAVVSRGRFGVRLTAEGERLYPLLTAFAQSHQALEQAIAALQNHQARLIRVGAYTSISAQWLPPLMQRFQEAHPEAAFSVQVGGIHELYEWVEKGVIDVGFGGYLPRETVSFSPAKRDLLQAILPWNHPLAASDTISLAQLAGEPFLMPSYGIDYEVQTLLEQAEVRPAVQNTAVDDGVVLSMVAQGMGVSILSQLVLDGYPRQTAAVPLSPPAYRALGVLHSPDRAVSPLARQFIKLAQRQLAEE